MTRYRLLLLVLTIAFIVFIFTIEPRHAATQQSGGVIHFVSPYVPKVHGTAYEAGQSVLRPIKTIYGWCGLKIEKRVATLDCSEAPDSPTRGRVSARNGYQIIIWYGQDAEKVERLIRQFFQKIKQKFDSLPTPPSIPAEKVDSVG